MKYLIPFLVLLFFTSFAEARANKGHGLVTGSNPRSHAVKPYIRKNGTYVVPHRATNPNGNKLDNFSTKGNVNPYTGKAGTQNPYNGK